MRSIERAIVHCSATPSDMDIGVEEIREWHIAKGWADVGYHFIVRRDGTVEAGRSISRPGAHARGNNRDSIGICLVGGVDAENKDKAEANFTYKQYQALDGLKTTLEAQLGPMEWLGHKELSPKACPCFEVREFFE